MKTDDEIGAEAAQIRNLIALEGVLRLHERLMRYPPAERKRLLKALAILDRADRALTETEVRKILRNG